MISPADVAILGAVALLLFGPEQLPKVARRVGGVVREVQNTSQSFIREMERAADLQEEADRAKTPLSSLAAPLASAATDFPAPHDYAPSPDHHAPLVDAAIADHAGATLEHAFHEGPTLEGPYHEGPTLEPAQMPLLAQEPPVTPAPSLFDEPKR